MSRLDKKKRRRIRRKYGIRNRVFGTDERPRLTVYKSLRHTYSQIIDDVAGRTLVAASTVEKELGDSLSSTSNSEAAARVGKALGERAIAADIKKVAFDRNGFKYHGRVKALADAAREAGLEF